MSRQSTVQRTSSRSEASLGESLPAAGKRWITTNPWVRGDCTAPAMCGLRVMAGGSAIACILLVSAATSAFAQDGGAAWGAGGNGSDNVLFFWFLQGLLRRLPPIPIPVLIIIGLYFSYLLCGLLYQLCKCVWDAAHGHLPHWLMPDTPEDNEAPSDLTAHEGFQRLRQFDPKFSEIAFTDFLYALYARAHAARGKGTLSDLSSYLSAGAINALIPGHPDIGSVSGVCVGSLSIRGVTDPVASETVSVKVRFKSTYTETDPAGKRDSYYVVDEWVLTRKRDVPSPEPEKLSAMHCPKCGSALDKKPDGSCACCSVKISGGDFNWYVTEIIPMERESQSPVLTREVPEAGTSRATVFQPDIDDQYHRLLQGDATCTWPHAEERFRHIFMELQNAWSTLEWDRARPYESDNVFQMHRYWSDAYQKQGMRNTIESVHIDSVTPVRIETDAFYDAITTRIFADMLDYTVDYQGELVCGSRSRPRWFSEYWTFMRRSGARDSTHSAANCPNCGALLKVNMAGSCDFCGGKITNGQFDWVLSRIEQDEWYTGEEA